MIKEMNAFASGGKAFLGGANSLEDLRQGLKSSDAAAQLADDSRRIFLSRF